MNNYIINVLYNYTITNYRINYNLIVKTTHILVARPKFNEEIWNFYNFEISIKLQI